MPSFVCALIRSIERCQPGALELDLASFRPGVAFGFELGLEFRFGLEPASLVGFDLEFGFGDGEIDHEAKSVGKFPCR